MDKKLREVADGNVNAGRIIQRLLDQKGNICIPEGTYRIDETLKIHSDTRLVLDPKATFILGNNVAQGPHDFLLTNSDWDAGNENISICGGIWDGNNLNNPRSSELYDENAATGTMINFKNVENLTLENMQLGNPECYYVALCRVQDFLIQNISFVTENLTANQDGIHLSGFCENGLIRNLKGTTGSPNDDFIAINADDCLTRLQNLVLENGPIRNITVQNIESPNCHTFIRMGSVNSTIENILIEGVRGGFKVNLINMDATRYCLTPLVTPDEDRFYTGVGDVRNVTIKDVEVYSLADGVFQQFEQAYIALEEDAQNFKVENIRIDLEKTSNPNLPILRVRNNQASTIKFSNCDIKSFGDGAIDAKGSEVNISHENNNVSGTINKPLHKNVALKARSIEEIQIEPLNV